MKLKTGEVSLVDSPANEVEFLVTKNLEENVMGEQQGTVGTDAERVEVEQSGNESEVANVLKHVNAIVENIATVVKAQAPQASAPAIAAATGTPAAGDDDEEDSEESVEKSIAAALKAAGIEPTEEQMKKMKAAGFDPSQKFPTAKKPMEKTKKAAPAPAAAEAVVAEAALTIEGFSELISKAKKFTPGRIEKLKGAVEALKGLLEEIDSVPQGTNPGVSPAGGTQFGASGVKVLTEKANGEPSDLVKAVTELANVVKGLAEGQKVVTEKVEAIEKARPASASLEAAGGTDTKVAKSALWSGIL